MNIVYGHHPYRSTGQHGDSYGELKALFDNIIATGQVHFILAGHHDQQLFTIRDAPTLIVSGAGSETRPVPEIFRLNGDLEFHSEALGICLLRFSKLQVTVEFYDSSGKVKYSKKINKIEYT